jgi:hypothetical protein
MKRKRVRTKTVSKSYPSPRNRDSMEVSATLDTDCTCTYIVTGEDMTMHVWSGEPLIDPATSKATTDGFLDLIQQAYMLGFNEGEIHNQNAIKEILGIPTISEK